ncbi:MAG TPA: hypothetical protein VE775_04770, partial [Pyrinomonadaceae bacterium]|nr:hypothetical protein [Pyrinomonadaceae bacterium]
IHAGQGPGLSSYALGQVAGTESTTLIQQNLPPAPPIVLHANGDDATTGHPDNNFPAPTAGFSYAPTTSTTMNAGAITGGLQGGSSVPLSILQPYLALNFVIALEGIFPSRN